MRAPVTRATGSISRWSAAIRHTLRRSPRQVTAERSCRGVRRAPAESRRALRLAETRAFNFVLDDVLEGGVNASLGLDGHGKSLSFLLLDLAIDIAPCEPQSARAGQKQSV